MWWCKAYFDILNRLGVTHECDRQTYTQTDILTENTALYYIARPIMRAKIATFS